MSPKRILSVDLSDIYPKCTEFFPFKILEDKNLFQILGQTGSYIEGGLTGSFSPDRLLRAAVCKYRKFAVKTEISKFFIFSQKKPFAETFSKITIKVSKEFYFSRKLAKSEMLPHAI